MARSLRHRIAALAQTFDPRVHVRTRQRLDEVRDHTRELRKLIDTIDVRTQQLLTLERLNYEQRDRLRAVRARLEFPRLKAHVDNAVSRATVVDDPFPHFIVDEWLPRDVYDTLVDTIPPPVFFADRPQHKQQLAVPFAVAPELSRQTWEFLSEEIVRRMFGPAALCRLHDAIDAYIRSICPAAVDWPQHVTLHASDGRLMLRRPGYVIEPHRDPRWGFVTCLAYLARPGDDPAWGTQLYRVTDDTTPSDESAHYVPTQKCTLARDVPFVANTVLVFLNSHGAHGASIPADAQPPTLERYMYQFRIGPDARSIQWLLDRMTPDQRRLWAGLKTERARGSYSGGM